MKRRKEDKINRRICLECSKYINLKKDHYVSVSTYNREISPDDHEFFHFSCWVDYFNKRVDNKMRSQISMMQEKATNLLKNPMIAGMLKSIEGSEIAMTMLQTPLQKEHFDLYHQDKIEGLKEVIKKRHKNDRRKRSAKKRKNKMQ